MLTKLMTQDKSDSVITQLFKKDKIHMYQRMKWKESLQHKEVNYWKSVQI